MQKRKYTRIKAVEAEILRMHSEGETHRSIAEVFGLEREQVKKFLKRHRENQAMLWERESRKPKGRPRKDGQPPRQNPETELKRLRIQIHNVPIQDHLPDVSTLVDATGGFHLFMQKFILFLADPEFHLPGSVPFGCFFFHLLFLLSSVLQAF